MGLNIAIFAIKIHKNAYFQALFSGTEKRNILSEQ